MLLASLRIALLLTSRLVPAPLRDAWLRKWVAGLPQFALWLRERGYDTAEIRRRLSEYAAGGLREAWSLRWPDDEFRHRVNLVLGAPQSLLALSLGVFAVGIFWSRGFALMRSSFQPMAPGLVTAEPAQSFFGKRAGFTSRQYFRVAAGAANLSAVEGYSTQRVNIAGQMRQVAVATPGLFALIGLPESCGKREEPGTVIADWRQGAAEPGTGVEVFGHKHKITGVWPRDFRVGLSRPDYWLVMDEAEIEERGFDMTLVARLRAGVPPESATAELRDLLLSVPARRGTGTPNTIVALRPGLNGLFGVLWRGYLIVLASLLAGSLGYLWVRGRAQWRKPVYLLAVVVPMLSGMLGMAGVWAAIPASGSSAGAFWILWCSATATALLIWWALRDSRLRCPECLTRMTKAVQMGTHANPLLEGVGDELLCEHGHGALWMPAVQAQAFGPEVWRGTPRL